MKTIKTAISIDSETFRLVNRLSKKLHMTRSRFFSQAARYMVEKNENLELLKKINAVVEQYKNNGDIRHGLEKEYALKNTVDKW
jgi:metal-responsive CopG/Arc/MetJ family transcriptional regulator